jgi:hypothetical protein
MVAKRSSLLTSGKLRAMVVRSSSRFAVARGGCHNKSRRHPLSCYVYQIYWIGLIGVILFVASASAASSLLRGIVKDANGHPIQGPIFGLKRQTLADCSRRHHVAGDPKSKVYRGIALRGRNRFRLSAGGGARTHTILRSLDFESSASANSATPAFHSETRFYL